MSRNRRGGAALIGGLLLVLVGAGPVAAHNRLRSSDPGDGSTVARTPAAVVLTLDQPPVAMGTRVVVTGPGGGSVSRGAPELVDQTVRQPLAGGAPAGRYTVEWRVTSADGHPISGRFSFVSEAAGSGTPEPAAPVTQPAQASSPAWGWTVLALVLLAAATALALRRRRGQAPE